MCPYKREARREFSFSPTQENVMRRTELREICNYALEDWSDAPTSQGILAPPTTVEEARDIVFS